MTINVKIVLQNGLITIIVSSLLFGMLLLTETYKTVTSSRFISPQPNYKNHNKSGFQKRPTPPVNATSISNSSKDFKIILYWIPRSSGFNYFGLKRYHPSFEDLKCPVGNCKVTEDKSAAYDADAIIFMGKALGRKPEKRNPKTRWIWTNHESPCHSYLNSDWTFNWTMTYRMDSDIYSPYGFPLLEKNHKETRERDFLSVARSKTKLAAWAVSNCNCRSRRMEYVKELQKYMSVDIYGRCGTFKCGRDREAKCNDMFNKTYKFDLSFENSFATDYITEKLYKILPLDVIPVTRSGANYTRLGISPSWHIDTHDFKSPKELAHRLKELDKDDVAYAKLLQSKAGIQVSSWIRGYCDICAKLHSPTEPVKSYSAQDIRSWYGTCKPPDDLRFMTRILNYWSTIL
ncbi:glycoprotein 3-alpha-L-fucosyltransferase A-like [Lingula anatina]|uniref:Fucosyltransferase n=1 Tax=Lingula anatina TaxID=7574 RepID=A0A1S3I1P1_LINAN|nr:glycoprotein 3-alpha-L-fucosyltransferase A-like [Lingula anatina]XP_013391747.1 glycoprotein 3-alpha-L-fucosyltransferase A-like [Lingula anatina]XP_013391748.1 glycoprotein 3-alpha-L-fucosyltransferase A-like [Lingula anatina]|eukprot:XP_013391746.1 glycoprotein 3-alpha-L-fucosyltransferase A-like [Lingula anatina]